MADKKKKKEKKKFRIPKWTFIVLWMPVVIAALYFGYVYVFVYPTFFLTQIEIQRKSPGFKRGSLQQGGNQGGG